MEKKTRKIEINIIIPLFWAFILVLCVFILSSTAKASGLPYYVDNDEFTFGNYSYTVNDILTFCNQNSITPLDFNNYPVIIYPFNDGIDKLTVICAYPENNTPLYYFDTYPSNFDTETDNLTFTYTHSCKFVVYVDRGNLRCNRWFDYTHTFNFFGQYYTPNYLSKNLYNNTYISNVYTEGDFLVLTNQVIPIGIQQGHATGPTGLNNVEPGSHTLPHQVPPNVTYNSYTWTTYNSPTIDTSTIESLLESLIYVINYLAGWLSSNLSGEFANLISNISNFVNYLGATIQYYCGLIIDNIQAGIQNFYQNMVSLFEPIAENIKGLREKIEEFADLFIHPFDEEEFEEQIENSSFFTNYNAIVDNCELLNEIIDYAEERDHFSLYISFENPLDNSVHRIISSEISFDWLVPLRSVYRPFIWVCVLIELFVGGARVLTHVLGGHGV